MPADGSLDYIELPGSHIAATKTFYTSLLGWTFTDFGPDYVAFEAPDGRQGGFNAHRKVVSSGGPLVVLYANDLGAMENKVRAAGAEIISRESFEGGRRFHFRDPNGNEIAVWTKA
jgi:predicted enzyme related to lactoylglutathione lyase